MKKYFERLYNKNMNNFESDLNKRVVKNTKTFIITANPETFMKAVNDEQLEKAIFDKNTIVVPDGIGIVKAAKMIKCPVKERIPGIDIAVKLLVLANKYKKTIYLFGSKEEIILSMKKVINEQYPNAILVGANDGYVKDKDAIFSDIKAKKPDVVLVALGIPAQEKLIYKHLNNFDKGIFIGVGGSLDVISGHKKRAPKIFIKLNLEWLYRLFKEPTRIKRFYNSNVKFMFIINKKLKWYLLLIIILMISPIILYLLYK